MTIDIIYTDKTYNITIQDCYGKQQKRLREVVTGSHI